MALNKEQKKQLTTIRGLIKSGDYATLTQAIELLVSLNDPDLWALMTEGLSLSAEGKLEIGKGEIKKRVKHLDRARCALYMARHSGFLDECAALDLSERITMKSLTFPTEDVALLAGLQDLAALTLYFCHRRQVDEALVDALKGLAKLHTLKLVVCHQLRSLQSFGSLSSLAALRTIALEMCTSLTDLSGLEPLTQLQHLRLDNCASLKDLATLALPKNLLSLDISSGITMMDKVLSLEQFQSSTQLESLSLRSVGRLTTLNGVQGMKNLHTLRMFGCMSLRNWDALQSLSKLHTLYLTGIRTYPFHLASLSSLPALRTLDLSGCQKLSNKKANLPHLQTLRLSSVGTKWSGPLVHLRYLLEDTEGLSNLQHLSLSGNAKLASIDGLGILPSLSTLVLSRCKVLKSISGLQACAPSLQELKLAGCQRLLSLSGLQGLQLQQLDLTGCSKITSLAELKDMTTLTTLNLSKCKSIKDLSILKGLPNLRSLTLSKRSVGADVMADLQASLPQLTITH